MSSRWHRKCNLLIDFLIEFSNLVFLIFFKANWHWTYIKNELDCWLSSKVFICPQDEKGQHFSGGLPPEPPPGHCHQPLLELTGPWYLLGLMHVKSRYYVFWIRLFFQGFCKFLSKALFCYLKKFYQRQCRFIQYYPFNKVQLILIKSIYCSFG